MRDVSCGPCAWECSAAATNGEALEVTGQRQLKKNEMSQHKGWGRPLGEPDWRIEQVCTTQWVVLVGKWEIPWWWWCMAS
jgi:hypothetical protein